MEHTNNGQERMATIGGTFDTLHAGHKAYIRLSFENADNVIIYVSSDDYAREKKSYKVRPYADRVDDLQHFIQEEMECKKHYQLRCLKSTDELRTDYLKRKDLRSLYMAIVSPEYYDFFNDLNRLRETSGLKTFLILVKPRSYNSMNHDISSHEVRRLLPCPDPIESR
jgi:cytidyltransferase-like protein